MTKPGPASQVSPPSFESATAHAPAATHWVVDAHDTPLRSYTDDDIPAERSVHVAPPSADVHATALMKSDPTATHTDTDGHEMPDICGRVLGTVPAVQEAPPSALVYATACPNVL